MSNISDSIRALVIESVKKHLESVSTSKIEEVTDSVLAQGRAGDVPSQTGKNIFDCAACTTQKAHTKAVLICAGKNSPGILAKITEAVSSCNGDIAEISQSILSGFFTLIMIVDIEGLSKKSITFMDLKNRLNGVSKELGLELMVVHEDIINSMQRV